MEYIDSEEFTELVAFEAKEPNPWDKLYFYIAQLTCYVVNVNKGKGKDLKLEDVMIDFADKAWVEEEADWKDIRQQLRNSLGDRVKGDKKWQQRSQEQ